MGILNSKVIIAKGIKMDRTYNNVLSYSENDLLNLLQDENHYVAGYYNYSFIKTQRSMLVNFTYAECEQSNYLAFQNPAYDNKWFFAWIDEVIYRGDKNTEITFTIDAWSTWFGKWTKKTCYIERQHTLNDAIGANTLPENLDVGEVMEESYDEDGAYSNSLKFWIAIETDYIINNDTHGILPTEDKGKQFSGITVYNKCVFGSQLVLFDVAGTLGYEDVRLYIVRTNMDEHIEDIHNIFIIPDACIQASALNSHRAYADNDEFYFYTLNQTIDPTSFITTITKRTSFSGYQPKNNKCFVYPYNYLLVSNNSGSNNIYKYENFSTANCQFLNQLAISIGVSGRIVPKYYKNMEFNFDESIALGKYPTCAWSSDAFTNWLTQNSVNIPVGVGLIVGGLALAAATGGASAAATGAAAAGSSGSLTAASFGSTLAISGASQVASGIGSYHEAKLLPNINGGQATGDVVWSSDKVTFTFHQMRVKDEYLKLIDDYFTRFRLCG